MITVINGKLTTADLETIPVRKPERAGNRWIGIGHHELATTLEQGLQERQIEVTRTAWTMGRNGQALFGGMGLKFPVELGVPELTGMEYALGIRHSNDMSMSLQMFCGVTVMICANGVATGSFILARKHTSGIDLDYEVNRGVDRLIEEAKKAGGVVETMKQRQLDQPVVDHMLCEAGRQQLLSWGHLGLVESNYRSPTHEEFQGRTAWSLYNSFNEVTKRVDPGRQLRSLDRFRQLVLAN